MRPSKRKIDQMRPLSFTRQFTKYAAGSVLACMGDTKVICTVSVEPSVPRFLHNTQSGWLTAEYTMLPSATHSRSERERFRSKPAARSLEIQRLIGRALRSTLDLQKIPGYTFFIDCDVLQADGGTRVTAINGAFVALKDAVKTLQDAQKIHATPLKSAVAAISAGIFSGETIVDLDYLEDSQAESDINIVMNSNKELIEIQGSSEGTPFSRPTLNRILDLAEPCIDRILAQQIEIFEQ